ncbi:MAG: threonine-phosphate decarboxylase CobD [Nostoc sp. ZfuVER08]|uniref:threonine-phosphate decarboxylase n=1 Tax=Nostoc punctiforme FACHB-252 TaxID=1357509 RepID=A0ABR8HC76_NOSPU|nr:threonine-phosphate decarboxylase CobD [Nostoc punctiforme]MBD2613043.1 threonine-phosphate decarboxylase [Nostoc punctiforme FACHB-252]MDZ8013885.1 threonine-phosphate decarboxylase CobD [Nostoc sp. ZfuVER08]
MRQPAHGGNLAWAAALAGCPPDAILDFSASISPLGPPNSAIAAIASAFGDIKHYPDPNYSELRLALSHFHQLPYEWILPGNGSAELLTLIGRELAQLAATLLITPAFGDYYRTLAAYKAKVLECPLSLVIGQESSVISSLSLFLDNGQKTKDKGLLLNNPHNPTGKLFSRDSILPYLEQFALVVVDEAFMDFVPPNEEQSLIPVVQEYANLVILRSLTKFYSLPGLRLGYAIAHPDSLSKWQQWRDPWPVNTLAVAAAIAALQDREFQQQTWTWLPPARKELFQGLAKIPGLQPQASAVNFLLVESQKSTLQLQQELLKHHQILIRDCLSFKELGDRFFRVAVREEFDNQRLLTALSEWGVGTGEMGRWGDGEMG